jgi:hypothetical protein
MSEQIEFVIPSDDDEGFIPLMEDTAEFQGRLAKEGFTVEVVRSLAVFLSNYIKADTAEARLALARRLSRKQFNELLAALTGGGAATIPPA